MKVFGKGAIQKHRNCRWLASLVITAWVFLMTAIASASQPIKIVAIGDSLIAGYGLKAEQGFTVQLESALNKFGHSVEIVNAGVSGDTTYGGLARVEWVLSDPYSGVILLLGNNDALRAIPPEMIRQNMTELIEKIQKKGLPLLLAGAMAPRNLGDDYVNSFDSIYTDLAAKYELIFYPFFLNGVATEPSLNQDDGVHPNAEGVALIVQNMTPFVEELIREIENR